MAEDLHFKQRIETCCPDDPIIPSVDNALSRIAAIRSTEEWLPLWGTVEHLLLDAKETRDHVDLQVARSVLVEALRQTGWLVGREAVSP